ncbi:MAG: hypothetical protein WAT81_00665 [Candidatus Moraniibacteriota bacterium]
MSYPVTRPADTSFFRCIDVMKLLRPAKDVIPHIYFESLLRSRLVFLTTAFRSQVLPLFNPDGKASSSAEYATIYVWQQRTPLSFVQAIKNWPQEQSSLPWYLLKEAFTAENDLSGPILCPDGRRILASMGGSPQTLNAGGTVDLGIPEYSVVRIRYNRLGSRPIWDVGVEDDANSNQSCPMETLFLTGG